MKKKTTVLLFAAMIGLFCSCTEKNSPATNPSSDTVPASTESPTESVEDTAEDDLSSLSEERFDGYNFRILTRKGHLTDQYLAEDDEDVVYSAVYRRNKAVEEKYGITISGFETSSDDYEVDALTSILAGDDAYDLVLAHSRAAFVYALQGAAYDINDIPTIHLDKPWWSTNLRKTFEVGGHLYILDGDYSQSRLDYATCLVFNKRIFDELGFDYPYEMVKDGDWTFDQFAYYAKKGGRDLNGDGILEPEYDQFGFCDGDWFGPMEILYTGGGKIYDKNEEGKLEVTLYTGKTQQIFDSYFSLMKNENCFLRLTDREMYDKGLFTEQRAMFMQSSLGTIKAMRSMDDDFGVLPWPKYDETDQYASLVNGYASLGIVPVTVSDVSRTGTIIEALGAYGRAYVTPAFYEAALKGKYARDSESEEMMDIVKDSIVYDIGYLSGGPLQSTGCEVARRGGQDFASFYAANEGAARIHVSELNAAMFGG